MTSMIDELQKEVLQDRTSRTIHELLEMDRVDYEKAMVDGWLLFLQKCKSSSNGLRQYELEMLQYLLNLPKVDSK